MKWIPSLQESNIVDWEIVDFETFWWPIEEWVPAHYFNNLFEYFTKNWVLYNFKNFLEEDYWNFSQNKIQEYTSKHHNTADPVTMSRLFIRYCAFAEYYRAFPEKTEKLIVWTNSFEELSNQLFHHISWKVHNLTDDYQNQLYHAYAYMRTQPWTSDAILTA